MLLEANAVFARFFFIVIQLELVCGSESPDVNRFRQHSEGNLLKAGQMLFCILLATVSRILLHDT